MSIYIEADATCLMIVVDEKESVRLLTFEVICHVLYRERKFWSCIVTVGVLSSAMANAK